MTLVEQLILDVLHKHTLSESEGKIDNFLSNQKNLDSMKQAIQSDPELTDKELDPKVLMLDWDNKSPITSKYIQWIGKQYINGQFYAGDIDQLAEDLRIFDKYAKGNKDIFPSADINTYTYSDLKPKVSQIDLEDTSRMGRNQQKAFSHAGKDEIEKVYDDNDFTIIIPKTKAAAIYWGSGSHWCTATKTDNNMFDHYNKMGPMYILLSKKDPDEKYQFHFETDQFMNKNNDYIKLYNFVNQYPLVKRFFREEKDLDKGEPKNWIWFDSKELSDEDYIKGLQTDGLALRTIPEHRKTYEMCLEAFDDAPGVWSDIPLKFRTEELCLETPSYLLDIIIFPDKIQHSKDFWLKYVYENPTLNTLTKLPDEFREYDIYKQLIKSRTEDDPRLFVNLDAYKEEICDRFDNIISEETLMKIRDDLIKELKDNFLKKK